MRHTSPLAPLLLLLLAAVVLPSAHAAAVVSADSAGCAIDLQQDLAQKEPLILKRNCDGSVCEWALPEGDEDSLFFEKGEEAIIACTSKKNKLTGFNTGPESLVAHCTTNPTEAFEVNGTEYLIQDFQCSRTSKGEILSMNVTCGPRNAELLEIGFNVREQWYPLIKVCHAKSRSETLYTEHILQGESTQQRRKVIRPSFEEGGFYAGFSANDAYRNSNKTLKEVTGYSKFPSSICTKIDRGHLSPDGDFRTAPYRYTTYFYVNTVPMWSSINRGNWATLEDKIRKAAKNYKIDLKITTGVFRVMELTDINGITKDFFLYTTSTRKQIPVPKFVWKVVYDEAGKRGIAFVMINDPFQKSISSSDELCPNICAETGWNDRKWKNISKGYLICCEVNQLKKYISYLPKYDITSVLTAR